MTEEAIPDDLARARRAAEAMYAEDRASQGLGIVVDEVAPGRARASMHVVGSMVNGHGIAHGGYTFLLADTAFAFACNTHGPSVAAAAQIVFLRPVREGDQLVADAVERSSSGSSGVYDVTVRRADGEVVAEFRGNSRRVRGAPWEARTT